MIIFTKIFSFSRKEVSHAFAHGAFFCRTKALKIIKAPLPSSSSDDQAHTKLLLVTPRRIGKAHERNLLRRRIKEIFYSNQLYNHAPALFVLFAYPGATELSYDELKHFLVTNFMKKNNESK